MPYTFLPENPVRGGIQQRYLDKSGAWDYLGSSKGFCFKSHILGIMKSIFKVFIFCLSFFVLGCSKKSNSTNQEFSIICTTFPLYDWVKNIIGENNSVKLDLLVDSGVDVHSYNPTPKDIVDVSKCDLFIYSGGVSENWVKDILNQTGNKSLKVVNLIEFLEEKGRVLCVPDGKEVSGTDYCEVNLEVHDDHEENHHEDKNHNHSHSHNHNHDEHSDDEHIWLSLKNAILICNYLCQELCSLDSENADLYRRNTENYVSKLSNLDLEFENAVDSANCRTLLFADRFPFVYLTNDYNIDVFAAFVGCSAETEASFETIAFLANKVDELNLQYLIVLENSSDKIANTIIKNSKNKNQEILILNSIQSCSQKQIAEGLSYFDVMTKNLEVLKKAFE